MKTKKIALIILTVVLALAVVGAVVWLVLGSPEDRLLKKIEGEYKMTEIVTYCQYDDYPESNSTRVEDYSIPADGKVIISKERVEIPTLDYFGNPNNANINKSPIFSCYNNSDEDLRGVIGTYLSYLEYDLKDIDVYSGKCLVAKNADMDNDRYPMFFLVYGDDVYTCSNRFYVELEKIK